MRTIEQQLDYIKQNKKIGLMTHVVVGFPSLQETEQLVVEMADAGVDFIELQIPFSDPLADGPTIMQANDVALENGVTLADCFTLMKKVSKKVEVPLLFMGYYHSIFQYGTEAFCKKAKEVGAQGLIIPDMPLDEEASEHFIASCKKYGLHHIRLLSPTSTDERVRLNAKYQNGFVYCTSRSGTTGSSTEMDPALEKYLRRIKKQITVPIALGFGISKPEHVSAIAGTVSVAVVGSAVIEKVKAEGVSAVPAFIRHLLSQV